MSKIIEGIVGLLPVSTLANILASLITKAMGNITDKDKAMKIALAASAVADAAKIASDAAKDCEITAGEIDDITASVRAAVVAIKEAAK